MNPEGYDEWAPGDASVFELSFKWGLNGHTGEVAIWEVGGPGDGFPFHRDHLLQLWDRELDFVGGDVVSVVRGDASALTVTAYGPGAAVPGGLLDLLRTRFPLARITA